MDRNCFNRLALAVVIFFSFICVTGVNYVFEPFEWKMPD